MISETDSEVLFNNVLLYDNNCSSLFIYRLFVMHVFLLCDITKSLCHRS
jgi:hypothetical protein